MFWFYFDVVLMMLSLNGLVSSLYCFIRSHRPQNWSIAEFKPHSQFLEMLWIKKTVKLPKPVYVTDCGKLTSLVGCF